jgi:hypothetical protein
LHSSPLSNKQAIYSRLDIGNGLLWLRFLFLDRLILFDRSFLWFYGGCEDGDYTT